MSPNWELRTTAAQNVVGSLKVHTLEERKDCRTDEIRIVEQMKGHPKVLDAADGLIQ